MNTIHSNNPEMLAHEACEAFFTELQRLVRSESTVVVSIPGGSSVKQFFMTIHRYAYLLSRDEWERVHIVWSDERCVPPDDAESNFRLAYSLCIEKLIAESIIPESNVHRFFGEAPDVHKALAEYNALLATLGGVIHIVILGVGPDGHVASLFPGHSATHHLTQEYMLVRDAPKLPPVRITIGPAFITNAPVAFLFFIGEPKREAYTRFLAKDITLPCSLAHQARSVIVITDLE